MSLLQVTALSTSGFMFPWGGGRTDVTVTTDTDTGRGLRRGTLQLMMEENHPHTVGLHNVLTYGRFMEDLFLYFKSFFLHSSFLYLHSSYAFPSHLLQQTHPLRGCSFCWGQRMATRNTSPTPCSQSWTKSASGRVRTPNGKRQPGTPLQSATWAGSGQLCLFSFVVPENLMLFVSD